MFEGMKIMIEQRAGREIVPLKQPNEWSCFATVAAMITGETVEEFVQFVGHDGGEYSPGSPYQDGRRGFRWPEVVMYLASHGFHLGVGALGKTATPSAEGFAVTVQVESPAVLIVPGVCYRHAVLWTGSGVLDPHPRKPEIGNLNDYTVLEWWPVQKVA